MLSLVFCSVWCGMRCGHFICIHHCVCICVGFVYIIACRHWWPLHFVIYSTFCLFLFVLLINMSTTFCFTYTSYIYNKYINRLRIREMKIIYTYIDVHIQTDIQMWLDLKKKRKKKILYFDVIKCKNIHNTKKIHLIVRIWKKEKQKMSK